MHGMVHEGLFYQLFFSWLYENGFVNFYQGLSALKNLKMELVLLWFAGFFCICYRCQQIGSQISQSDTMSSCFGLV